MVNNLADFFGFSGVDRSENYRAVKAGRMFEWPMILVAFWIVLEWYIEAQSMTPLLLTYYSDWVIWSFFVIETAVLLILVDNKSMYLKRNWAGLAIIVAGMPLLWEIYPHAGGLRLLRLLVLFSLLFSMSSSARKVLSNNHLGTTLMVSFLIVIFAGTLMATIDPNIETPLDGIWWAWVTVTTVGYGDLVPSSNAGRLFAGLLMLMGIAIFSLLTASFSSFFLSQAEEKISVQETENAENLLQLRRQVQDLEEKIDQLLAQK